MSAKTKSSEAKPVYLTPKQVCELFNVHPETLRRWVARGVLTPTVLGGTWRYHADEVERFEHAGSLEVDRTRRKAIAKVTKEAKS